MLAIFDTLQFVFSEFAKEHLKRLPRVFVHSCSTLVFCLAGFQFVLLLFSS